LRAAVIEYGNGSERLIRAAREGIYWLWSGDGEQCAGTLVGKAAECFSRIPCRVSPSPPAPSSATVTPGVLARRRSQGSWQIGSQATWHVEVKGLGKVLCWLQEKHGESVKTRHTHQGTYIVSTKLHSKNLIIQNGPNWSSRF
jgi:hypothetical protein